jgi:lysosomal Pro-X carboxypeptidase
MTQPFSSGLGGDMFFPPTAFNLTTASDGCFSTWGVRPRPRWATLSFGSKVQRSRIPKHFLALLLLVSQDLSSASNIVFTNGQLDPWRAGGVVVDNMSSLPPSVVSFIIDDGQQLLFNF